MQVENAEVQHNLTADFMPNEARRLPGCRSGNLAWRDFKIEVVKSDDCLTMRLHSTTTKFSRRLSLTDGKLRCNLQEFELVRWIAEEDLSTQDSIQVGDLEVDYQYQRRYHCVFPHPPDAGHDVLEIAEGMAESDLQNLGEEAIRDRIMVLCPAAAPTRRNKIHKDVTEEIQQLASYWPTRQTHSCPAVEGMIDIDPVMIYRNHSLRDQCTALKALKKVPESLPTEVRPTGLLNQIQVGIHSALVLGKKSMNPDIPLHQSWLSGLQRVTQPAVLRCKHRKAEVHPTRLYDTRGRNAKRGIRPSHYLALSYCWDEWPEDSIDALRDRLHEISERLGIQYFWVDRWCIHQDDPKDKEREISRMRDYYTGASGCVVLTGPSAVPFKCVPKHEGAILAAIQQLRQNEDALKSLTTCKWATRVWTLQEALMSRQLVYAIHDQLIDGDYVSELVSYVTTASEYSVQNGDIWLGGYGCYRWDARTPTAIFPRQFRILEDSPQKLTVIRTVFGGEQQHRELQSASAGLLMPLEEALAMTADRLATKSEDYIYGILGISEGGGKVTIDYGIDWKAMLTKLRESELVTERQLAAATVNEETGWSWLPKCGHNYGPFKHIERLSAFVPRPPLPTKGQSITIFGVVFEFEWQHTVFKKWPVHNIHGQPCYFVEGTIRFPGFPGVRVRACATSSTTFWATNRLEGTHVMLFEGVNRDTKDTVAIRVSGDIENGRVSRQDGYVLEMYTWLEGDPNLLRGKQWLLDSSVCLNGNFLRGLPCQC